MPIYHSDNHPAFAMAHAEDIRSLRQVPESGYPGYDQYIAPARYWGERLGIPEIYRTYEDVLGDRHAGFEDELFSIHKRRISEDERDRRILELYDLLIAAHQDLPHEIVITTDHVKAIVHGCVSQFCPEDIRFYIADKNLRSKQAWQGRKAEVQALAGGWHFEWCPGFHTLDAIENAILGNNFGHR
ncbi:hypothetical protein G6L37_06375 [Agrobacterium rubi]|nr:hypothetical protein [Agrobacterium rubi]NTF24988.1 hypothetical protein [Agrobacterium rubi]